MPVRGCQTNFLRVPTINRSYHVDSALSRESITSASIKALMKVVPVSNNYQIDNNNSNIEEGKCKDKIQHACIKKHRHSRLCFKSSINRKREREPSRINIKKIMILLKVENIDASIRKY